MNFLNLIVIRTYSIATAISRTQPVGPVYCLLIERVLVFFWKLCGDLMTLEHYTVSHTKIALMMNKYKNETLATTVKQRRCVLVFKNGFSDHPSD